MYFELETEPVWELLCLDAEVCGENTGMFYLHFVKCWHLGDIRVEWRSLPGIVKFIVERVELSGGVAIHIEPPVTYKI